MQPRRDLLPLLDTVFHVMNRGCDSFGDLVSLSSEKTDVREDDFEDAGVLDPVGTEDAEDLVEGKLEDEDEDEPEGVARFNRRDIAAGRAGDSSSVSASTTSLLTSPPSSISSSAPSANVVALVYCCQSSCTCCKSRGRR